MSTTGVTTWAVDLAEVGAVYPFQGWEVLMAIVGVVAWLGWHVWCVRWELQYHRERIAKYANSEDMKRAIDRH
jgi:DUF2075 family protein